MSYFIKWKSDATYLKNNENWPRNPYDGMSVTWVTDLKSATFFNTEEETLSTIKHKYSIYQWATVPNLYIEIKFIHPLNIL